MNAPPLTAGHYTLGEEVYLLIMSVLMLLKWIWRTNPEVVRILLFYCAARRGGQIHSICFLGFFVYVSLNISLILTHVYICVSRVPAAYSVAIIF